jgi:hypothetical protein
MTQNAGPKIRNRYIKKRLLSCLGSFTQRTVSDSKDPLCRGKRAYHPGPLTLRVRLRSGRDHRRNLTLQPLGDNESRKTIEKAAGLAPKEKISIEYRSILGGPKVADTGQMYLL